MNQEETALINKQTGITVGLAIVVLGAAVSAAWWFGKWTGADSAWKLATDQRLVEIEASIDKVVTEGTSNRWSSVDMIRWCSRLRESNPELRVPEPYANKNR